MSGKLNSRGAFKGKTTTPRRRWVILSAQRGAVAAVIAGLICYVVAGLPAHVALGLMAAIPPCGYGVWRYLESLNPVDGEG